MLGKARRCRRCVHYSFLCSFWLAICAAALYCLATETDASTPSRVTWTALGSLILRAYLTVTSFRFCCADARRTAARRAAQRTHAWFYVNVPAELIENAAHVVFTWRLLRLVAIWDERALALSLPARAWCLYGAVLHAYNAPKEVVNLFARHPSLKAPATACVCAVTLLGFLSFILFMLSLATWMAGLFYSPLAHMLSADYILLASFMMLTACQVFWLLRGIFHMCGSLQTTS